MKIEDLTLGQILEIKSLFNSNCPVPAGVATINQASDEHPYVIGKNYFIRTVTHHYTGTLEQVFPHELVLKDAAWIADDGRFAQAVESGDFTEIEPFPKNSLVVIGRGAVLDAVQVGYPMPRSQK